MGLSVNIGPRWEEDSHGYINRATSEINIREKYFEQRIGYDNLKEDECLMLTNPNISRQNMQPKTSCRLSQDEIIKQG